MQQRDVIIIGGGPAGRSIVHQLHHSGRPLSVTLIKDERINVKATAISGLSLGSAGLKEKMAKDALGKL